MARRSASQVPAKASNGSVETKIVRCAIYTRKSTEEGLQQQFNSLDAQREASEAFVASQKHEGWQVVTEHFDDGGYTGGNMDRPALKRLLAAVEARTIDCIVVYKVDRLSRSLLDFARIIEVFDRNAVSFVAVTQQFNTTSSLGRLTLNILLSFAQFEREIISERTRDKMSAARRKGKWIGGHPVLGYDIDSKGGRIIVNPAEAEQVRILFGLLTPGYTLDNLDGIVSYFDSGPYASVSLDSRFWTGGKYVLGCFDGNNKFNTLNGTSLDALADSSETQFYPGYRAMINNVRPLVDGGSTVTVQVGYRDRILDTEAYTLATAVNATGDCYLRNTARYHRIRTNTSGSFNYLQGVDVEVSREGKR